MNGPARALFSAIRMGMESSAQRIASDVRAVVGPELLSVEQHEALERVLLDGLEGFTWQLLSRFDNVGCSLPEGTLGYRIVAQACVSREYNEDEEVQELPESDIREGEQDYASMWRDYLSGAA